MYGLTIVGSLCTYLLLNLMSKVRRTTPSSCCGGVSACPPPWREASSAREAFLCGSWLAGCLPALALLQEESIDLYRTLSILGYSLMPVVGVAVCGVFLEAKSKALIGAALVAVTWCTSTASRFFESVSPGGRKRAR